MIKHLNLELLGFGIILGVILSLFQKIEIIQPKEQPPPIKAHIDLFHKDKLCLREMLYFETRSLSDKERNAVLDVAVNRFLSNKFLSNFCKVVQQPRQYSYRNGISKSKIILPEFWKISQELDRKAWVDIMVLVESRLGNNTLSDNVVLPYGVMFYHTKEAGIDWGSSYKRIKLDKSFKHVYYSVVE